MSASRPGTGGRQPRATPYTETTATADLHAQLGPPQRHSLGGAQMLVWEQDPAGTGAIMARLSGRELQNGETALGQVHPARALCDSLGLPPRLIVVTVYNGGARDYERRPDFGLLEDAVEEGWLEFVVWRDVDRLAREPLPAELFYRFIRRHNVQLLLTRVGRAVVWNQDRTMLRTLGVFSAEERELIKARTHDALSSRWLEEGRGWPGSRVFGFRRNPITKFLEVDPDQWEFVKRVHYDYADVAGGAGKGVRPLAEHLRGLGCSLSRAQLRRMLSNRIYVDGHWHVEHEGRLYHGQTVALADPIPPEIFQRNQELLAQRQGKNTHTPQGTFCLNSVVVEHARCAEQRNDRGLAPRLRGRIQGSRSLRAYKHRPWVPATCRGYRLDQELIEPAVLAALRGLWDSPDLQDRWAKTRGLRPQLAVDPLLSAEQLGALRARERVLSRQRGRLERLFLDRLGAGEAIDERAFAELTDAVSGEIKALQARAQTTETNLAALGPRASQRNRDASGLQDALADVLCDDVPGDAQARTAREALVAAMLDKIVVCDDDDGTVVLELHSPFARG